MTDSIPEVIDRYVTSAAKGDLDTLIACFTADADVTDEDVTYRGHAAIRKWREDIAGAFEYTVTVLSAEPTGSETYLVTCHVEGNFPGSPVQLRYEFVLRDGLIGKLEIAP